MAGNVGNDSSLYAFQVEQSGSNNTVIWIIVGAAGGAALLVVSTPRVAHVCWDEW